MPSRQERLVRNQQTFRYANERLQDLVEERVDGRGPVPFLCECADLDCRGRVELMIADYEAVHIMRDRYVILPGHPMAEAEEILEEIPEGYLVVQKN